MKFINFAAQDIAIHIDSDNQRVTSKELFDLTDSFCSLMREVYWDGECIPPVSLYFDLDSSVMEYINEVRLSNVRFNNFRDWNGKSVDILQANPYCDEPVSYNVTDLFVHMKTTLDNVQSLKNTVYEIHERSEMSPHHLNEFDNYYSLYLVMLPNIMPIFNRFAQWREDKWRKFNLEERVRFVIRHGYKYDNGNPNFFENPEQFI